MKKNPNRAITHQMLERLTYIHNRIKAECFPKTSELAKELECSVPTISRDITFLRDRFNAPIEYNAQKKGFYYSKKYEMPIQNKTVTYRIAFYGESRLAIKDSVWADDQKITEYDEEGKTEIVFSAAQGYRILKWVLSHGSNAQPLEPEDFVQDWQAEIQAMVRRMQ